jgi:5'-phosphate synthase pdxT subunit
VLISPETVDNVKGDFMAPVVGVLALQGDVVEHLAMLERAGARALPVRREKELSSVDGMVLPGGESTTMSTLLDAFDLLQPLRAVIRAGLPMFGSCAGMILLADQVLDGRGDQHQLGGLDVVVRRNAFGRQVDSFEADLEFSGIEGGRLPAIFIRAPWVEQVGQGVEILARAPELSGGQPGKARIVAVKQGSVLATAFHPELTGDERVHRMFVDLIRHGR